MMSLCPQCGGRFGVGVPGNYLTLECYPGERVRFCSYACLMRWAASRAGGAGQVCHEQGENDRLKDRIRRAFLFVELVANENKPGAGMIRDAQQWLIDVGERKPAEVVIPEYCEFPPFVCSGTIRGRANGKWMCEKHLNEVGFAVVTIG